MKRGLYLEVLVRALLEGPKTTLQLAEELLRVTRMSDASAETIVLKHMKLLEDYGLVQSERKRVRIYQLSPWGAWVLLVALSSYGAEQLREEDAIRFIERQRPDAVPLLEGYMLLRREGIIKPIRYPLSLEGGRDFYDSLLSTLSMLDALSVKPTFKWEEVISRILEPLVEKVMTLAEGEGDKIVEVLARLKGIEKAYAIEVLRKVMEICENRLDTSRREREKILAALSSL